MQYTQASSERKFGTTNYSVGNRTMYAFELVSDSAAGPAILTRGHARERQQAGSARDLSKSYVIQSSICRTCIA